MSTDSKLKTLKSKLPDADDAALLELLVTCNGNVSRVLNLMGVSIKDAQKPASSKVQSTLWNFSNIEEPRHKKRRTDIKSEMIHIYTPKQLEALDIPCTMALNFLPKRLADDLLVYLLEESKDWSMTSFYMFERLVASHHTHAMYSSKDKASMSYYGREVKKVLPFNELLKKSRDLVQEHINHEIQQRGSSESRLNRKTPPWSSETVIVNHYKDKAESVGYHSDQLTHLGPEAIIGSLSLGVTREFRLKSRHDPTGNSTISLHIPHNCLIVMHATCQELFKHAVLPASSAFDPHPISGQSRINLTYRMYPEEFDVDKLPLCDCRSPMILRTTTEQKYKYIWQCAAGYSNRKGCSKILYPDFTSADPLGLSKE